MPMAPRALPRTASSTDETRKVSAETMASIMKMLMAT